MGGYTYGLGALTGALSIQASGGTNYLNLDDRGELYARQYTLTGNTFLADSTVRISFADVHDLVVDGGKGQGNAFFGNVGNTFDILDTLPLAWYGSKTTIYAGQGRDVVNVRGTTGALAVDFQQDDLAWLNVGSPEHGLDPIQGSVSLLFGGSGLSVDVDDSGAAAGQSFRIDANGLQRTGAAAIDFGSAQGFSLGIHGGTGGNIYDIQGKRGNLWLGAGEGNDTINVGAAGGLLSNLGFFVINGQGGSDTLNLLDQGEVVDQTYEFYVLTDVPAAYEGLSVFTTMGTTILLGDKQTEMVALFAGSGSDTFNGQDAGGHSGAGQRGGRK